MNRYYIDEIIDRLIEMRKDGYRYCQFIELEKDDEINRPACITFDGLDCGGYGACCYDEVNCVPDEEVLKYAEVNAPAPKHRMELHFEDTLNIDFKF